MFVFPILWTSFHQIGSVNKALLLWYWQQLRKCFLGICNTFLFFKIERWKFQHLFKYDFNSIRQPKKRMKITIFWMSWNFVRFHEILFQRNAESFSFILKNKKVLFLKRYFLSRKVSKYAKIDPKDGAYCPNFQWRFWLQQNERQSWLRLLA